MQPQGRLALRRMIISVIQIQTDIQQDTMPNGFWLVMFQWAYVQWDHFKHQFLGFLQHMEYIHNGVILKKGFLSLSI